MVAVMGLPELFWVAVNPPWFVLDDPNVSLAHKTPRQYASHSYSISGPSHQEYQGFSLELDEMLSRKIDVLIIFFLETIDVLFSPLRYVMSRFKVR